VYQQHTVEPSGQLKKGKDDENEGECQTTNRYQQATTTPT